MLGLWSWELTAFCSSPANLERLSVKVSAIRKSIGLDLEHLHHFIAKVVDHLHSDPAGLWSVERPGGVAVQSGPGFGIDLGFEGGRTSPCKPLPNF